MIGAQGLAQDDPRHGGRGRFDPDGSFRGESLGKSAIASLRSLGAGEARNIL